MAGRPLDTPTNLPSTTEDTYDTTHVFIEIPLDVQMDDSSESVEEEKGLYEIANNLNDTSPAVAAEVDDDEDDPDDETSALPTHHEPGAFQGTDIAAVEDASASTDNGSNSGTVFFPGEGDSNNDSMSTSISNFGMFVLSFRAKERY